MISCFKVNCPAKDNYIALIKLIKINNFDPIKTPHSHISYTVLVIEGPTVQILESQFAESQFAESLYRNSNNGNPNAPQYVPKRSSS